MSTQQGEQTTTNDYDYDLIVLGGGSGGLAASKEAMACGARRVACFDFVKPTVHGTKWGLGGTCVNVGCVPKKLMHYAALMGPLLRHDASKFGWNVTASEVQLEWSKLVATVQEYVKRLNFSYRVGLRSKQVEYHNRLACVEGPNLVSFEQDGERKTISAKYILVAVGSRPRVPSESEVPGAAKYAITSDDLFSWKRPPGKTLVVGASYIALECAGFLTEYGFDTTVAVRSVVLRTFDRQCAEKVASLMREQGTKFINTLPSSVQKLENGRLLVKFADAKLAAEEFDTVLYATGRDADTQGLNLEAIGVKLDAEGKILSNNEQTTVPSIFVVGDALSGGLELTPVAIKAGELLVRRLFKGSRVNMDYNLIPTTVFSPFEYSCCGLSEEAAIEKYGKDNIETFLFEFPSLESAASHRPKAPAAMADPCDVEMSPTCLSKLVCLKSENMRVVGFHYVGPNAGELAQGYALALRLGACKEHFDNTVGIHPTNAESFHGLSITRASGESFVAAGGCGGGKCG